MDSKKKTIIQTIVCVGLVCLIWAGYFFANRTIKINKHRQITLREDDFSWVYQVDSVKTEGKDFVLRGFAFGLDKDATEGEFEIVLHDIESGQNYFPEMEYMEREDVNGYFLCEYDYVESGFEATIKVKKLNLEERDYEVLLRLSNDSLAYQTGTYISKGELAYANPLEFEPLDVAESALEEIVEQGTLRVYRPDCGMYVYQYKGELYWIAEPEYGFVNEDTYVQYHLDTTQIENLPEVRLKNEWYWDNIGFLFSSCEITEGNMGKYRVAKKALPTEYAIEKIWTGNHIDEWIWIEYFRPYYDTLKE